MEAPIGIEYRRASGETIYYVLFAALFAGVGLFGLVRWGSTSGLIFIVSAAFAYQAIQSRRVPYAVVNAETLTVWGTPLSAQTVVWRTLTSARRLGQRVRLGLPDGKTLDLRWDAVVPDARARFLAEFAAHLDTRWTDDPGDARSEAWRQWVPVAVLAVALTVIVGYLIQTGRI